MRRQGGLEGVLVLFGGVSPGIFMSRMCYGFFHVTVPKGSCGSFSDGWLVDRSQRELHMSYSWVPQPSITIYLRGSQHSGLDGPGVLLASVLRVLQSRRTSSP